MMLIPNKQRFISFLAKNHLKTKLVQKMIKKVSIILALVIVGFMMSAVAAYVYESGTIAPSQTIKNIATLTLGSSVLGNIEEGQTIFYTKTNTSSLGGIANLTTYKSNVYLHCASNLNTLSSYYSNYTVVLKYAAVPGGSTHNVGDIACTMTLVSPTATAASLDQAGAWRFDMEVTTTALSGISADTPTAPTITVTAESS